MRHDLYMCFANIIAPLVLPRSYPQPNPVTRLERTHEPTPVARRAGRCLSRLFLARAREIPLDVVAVEMS